MSYHHRSAAPFRWDTKGSKGSKGSEDSEGSAGSEGSEGSEGGGIALSVHSEHILKER